MKDNFNLWKTVREQWKFSKTFYTFLSQSDCPYTEKVPSIKIPMDIMEQEPFLSDSKPADSE